MVEIEFQLSGSGFQDSTLEIRNLKLGMTKILPPYFYWFQVTLSIGLPSR